jgi:hypothetical protein
MSQILYFGSTGGGGTVNSLTPDSGAAVPAVAGTIPVLGYPADTVQTMETYNDGAGNFRIADQTWQTQYVVDASTTDGLKGTFTTIQSAIDQAVLDGALPSAPRKIFVRPGLYVEDLTIPGGIIIEGDSNSQISYSFIIDLNNFATVIQGTHDYSSPLNGGAAFITNITFINNGNNRIFNITGNGARLVFNECNLYSTSASSEVFVTNSGVTDRYVFNDCSIIGSSTTNFTVVLNDDNVSRFVNCDFGSIPPLSSGLNTATIQINGTAQAFIENCASISSIEMNGTSYLECYDTTFGAGIGNNEAYYISGTGVGGYLSNVDFGSSAASNVAPTSGYAIQNTTGGWAMNGCTSYGCLLFELGTVTNGGQSNQGDVVQTKSTAVSYVASQNDYYIGVTSTASARTITIPQSVNEGKVFYIKDESGAAGTNAITVSPSAGLIEGQASQDINTNYGTMQIIKRGSNYFII